MPAFTLEAQAALGYIFAAIWGIIALACASRISLLFHDLGHSLAWPLMSAKVVLLVLLVLWALFWAFLGELELIHPDRWWCVFFSYVFNVVVVTGIKPMSVILFTAIVSTPAIQPITVQNSHNSSPAGTCHKNHAPRETFHDVDDLLVQGESDNREVASPHKAKTNLSRVAPMTLYNTGFSDKLSFPCGFTTITDTPYPSHFVNCTKKLDLDNAVPSMCEKSSNGRERGECGVSCVESGGRHAAAPRVSSDSTIKDTSWIARKGTTLLHFFCGSIPDDVADSQKDPARWASLLRWRLLLGLRPAGTVWILFLVMSITFTIVAAEGEIRSCDERTSETVACKVVNVDTEEKQVYIPRTLSILSLGSNALLLMLWTVKGVATLERIGNAITKKSFQRTFLIGALLLAALTLYDCVLMFETLRFNVLVNGIVFALLNITEGYLVLLLMLRLGTGSRRMPRWYTSIVSCICHGSRTLRERNGEVTVV